MLIVIKMYETIYTFNTVSSTMEVAHMLASYVEDKVVIWAKKQIAGRGRGNRKWFSPEGGLWLSIVERSPKLISHHGLLGLSAAFAIHDTLQGFMIDPWVKWPNDVMVKDKKIAGILIDAKYLGEKIQYVIIGIGINVNNTLKGTLLEDTAISLRDITGKTYNLRVFLNSILKSVRKVFNKLIERPSFIVKEFENRSRMVNKKVKIFAEDGKVTGICKGIDEEGSLIILGNNGIVKVIDYGIVKKVEVRG